MGKARLAIGAAVVAVVAAVALPASAGSGNITGYPTRIATVDLTGYKLQTFYPLGTNAVNTFDQDYVSNNHVSAVGVKGPGRGWCSSRSTSRCQ
jgi:hypothetical protein